MKDSNIHELYKSYSMYCADCNNRNLILKEDSFGKKWVYCSKCGAEIHTLTWERREEVNDESETD